MTGKNVIVIALGHLMLLLAVTGQGQAAEKRAWATFDFYSEPNNLKLKEFGDLPDSGFQKLVIPYGTGSFTSSSFRFEGSFTWTDPFGDERESHLKIVWSGYEFPADGKTSLARENFTVSYWEKKNGKTVISEDHANISASPQQVKQVDVRIRSASPLDGDFALRLNVLEKDGGQYGTPGSRTFVRGAFQLNN